MAELARFCDGDCVWYGLGAIPEDAPGTRAVRWIDDTVCLLDAGATQASATPVLAAGDDALALCAAAAAAWASGLTPELIAAGLAHFDSLPHP